MVFIAAEKRYSSILDQVEAIERQLPQRPGCAATQAIHGIGEVNGAVGFRRDVVGSAETLALVAAGENRTSAVLFETHDIAVSHGSDKQAALPIERQAV